MKPMIDISSVISEVNLPKRNLEAIANHKRSKQGIFVSGCELPGYENISWRFMNALGKGKVQMSLLNKENNKFIYKEIPASAAFLVMCTKGQSETYQLQFAISLT